MQIYSAGFSDVVPFACPVDSAVLTISVYDKTLLAMFREYPRSGWSESQFNAVESRLKPHSCGARFRHDAMPKCPHCGVSLISSVLGVSEFVVVGEIIDGQAENAWLDLES
ncbi:MAG: hypothetical protein AUI21_03595 [Nitrospirae bacterium 13_1_40CM_2_62_10]|nr:MAG: hypothetical protein AUI21_03595 [Nitrospirae bacterium 13_1_40CM_2_62_10]